MSHLNEFLFFNFSWLWDVELPFCAYVIKVYDEKEPKCSALYQRRDTHRERDTEIDKGGWEVKRLNLPQLTRIQEAVAYWLCKLKKIPMHT